MRDDKWRIEAGLVNECWPWVGRSNPRGYGLFRLRGQNYMAHRVAYELFIGPIPKGLHVCHKCDNPACCNPRHLFVGDDFANVLDRIKKGRPGSVSKYGLPYGCRRHGERYQAQIWFKGRLHTFGTHDTPEAAHAAALLGRASLWKLARLDS